MTDFDKLAAEAAEEYLDDDFRHGFKAGANWAKTEGYTFNVATLRLSSAIQDDIIKDLQAKLAQYKEMCAKLANKVEMFKTTNTACHTLFADYEAFKKERE